jgi:hypothetical protein
MAMYHTSVFSFSFSFLNLFDFLLSVALRGTMLPDFCDKISIHSRFHAGYSHLQGFGLVVIHVVVRHGSGLALVDSLLV